MIRVPGTVDVDRPTDVVFPYLSDPHNQHEWTPNFLELLSEPDRPPGVGMQYRGKLRLFGAVSFVIDQFDPGRSFRVDTDPRADASHTASTSIHTAPDPGSRTSSSLNPAVLRSSPRRCSLWRCGSWSSI